MYQIDKDKVKKIKEIVSKSKKILITGHTNPDGDAIGSALSLFHFFNKLDIETTVVMPDEITNSTSWLVGANSILINEDNKALVSKHVAEADVIFCVDFNEPKRLKSLKDAVVASKAVKVMIDHHPQPNDFVDFTFSDTNISSASEYVYYFLKEYNNNLIDKTIAECIFLGITTDTGCFNFSSATSPTFIAAAELLAYGVDKQKILSNTFDNYSENRMRLMGYVLQEKLVVMPEQKAAYIGITKEEFEKFDYQNGDHEYFVNLALSIKNVEVSALFLEMEESVRISLRSGSDFDVNVLARKYFKGGGHKKAAGGKLYMSLVDTISRFEKAIIASMNIKNN